jgi:hypothetical protein
MASVPADRSAESVSKIDPPTDDVLRKLQRENQGIAGLVEAIRSVGITDEPPPYPTAPEKRNER